MRAYTDIFGKPLNGKDITLAVQTIIIAGKANTTVLQRNLGWGYGKIGRVYGLLEDANVVGKVRSDGTRHIIFSHPQAINAALRQLKKGKK